MQCILSLSPKIPRERVGTTALWMCSLQSLGGAADSVLSSPDAAAPSDEPAQALEDTAGSHAALPGRDRVGREDRMSLSSQAPSGRKASPLMGFQRDLQIFGGSSALRKAPQAGGESSSKIRTRCVLGGRLCRDKGIKAVGSEMGSDLPLLQLSKLWLFLLSVMSLGSLLSPVNQQVPGECCHF